MANLSVPTFCVVTGASRGLGREIAIQLAKKIGPGSSLYLLARNKDKLEETALAIKKDVGDTLQVNCVPSDLSSEEGITQLRKDIFENVGDISRFSHAIIVHNAATVGMSKFARELDDVNFLQQFLLLNITAPIVLTSSFFSCFGHGKDSIRKTVIQVTSDNATTPYQTMHIYCMAKAGRDMFFKVMALEEPEVRILSYDPGAVDTDMFRDTYGSPDPEFQASMKNIAKESYFLKAEQSAEALVKALEEDKYANADVIRSYDVLGIKADF